MENEWKMSFVAMGAILGEPLDETLAAIEGAAELEESAFLRTLRSAPRAVRARAIADVLAGVIAALPQWEAG